MMKVKAADIARALGISKATVSLALNKKPGVSEKTRQEIMACRERLMDGGFKQNKVRDKNQLIKVVIANKNLKILQNTELDLWTDVLAIFDGEARRMGYSVGVTYVDIWKEDVQTVVDECNQELVGGVILEATELQCEDFKLFQGIQKPMVVYDNDSEDVSRYSVVIDNRGGMKIAMEYLYQRHKRKIVYLANEANIYNFRERRRGYREYLFEHNLETQENQIVPIGTTIESVYQNMLQYLDEHILPQAFVMENYQVSIGVMRAMREKKIKVPEDISLIGIDEIPSYVTGDCSLTTIRIPHTDRARMVMLFLQREIEGIEGVKSVVMAKCNLSRGSSVE